MTTTNPRDESPHDDSGTDEQHYNTDAAVAIATERIAEDLDPAGFGDHRRLDDVLGEFTERVRADEVSDMGIADVRTHLRNLDDALDELRRLYGFDDDRSHATGEERIAEILEPLEVSRDDLGSTRIRVSDAVTTHVYDSGDPSTVTIDLDALDAHIAEDSSTVTLEAADAVELRSDLETAFTARLGERRRYDREAEE